MKQYCRYCAELVAGNGIYCGAHQKEMSEAKTKCPNHCQDFVFVNIDAYGETSGYKPRRKKEKQCEGQIKLPGLEDGGQKWK